MRGALAIVTNVRRDAVDAMVRKTSALLCTAKSCGSDAPMQALSFGVANAARERWCHNKQGHQDDLV